MNIFSFDKNSDLGFGLSGLHVVSGSPFATLQTVFLLVLFSFLNGFVFIFSVSLCI